MLSIDAWLDEKPYREVFDGAIHAKVSPRTVHSILAFHIGTLLAAWGGRRVHVGVEWRVHLAPRTTLVPDTALFWRDRLAPLTKEEYNTPPFAPDIAVEVRSPEDRVARIARKTALYLAYGATIVLNVDPRLREVQLSAADGERVLHEGDFIEHPTLPGLRIPVTAVFEPLEFGRA